MKMAVPIYQDTKRFYPISYEHIDFLSNFAVPIICKSQAIRDMLVEKCNNNIEIRPIVGGDMTQQPFFKKYSKKEWQNSNAKLVHNQGLYFGNNPDLTEREINEIIQIFTT